MITDRVAQCLELLPGPAIPHVNERRQPRKAWVEDPFGVTWTVDPLCIPNHGADFHPYGRLCRRSLYISGSTL